MPEDSDMSGRWVGPCAIKDFFKLAMPIKLRKRKTEKLPNIDKNFFAGKKPASAKAMTKTCMEFFGGENFPGIKLVNSSANPNPNSEHGSKVRPVVNIYDGNSTTDPNSPTRLGDALAGVDINHTMIELFNDEDDDEEDDGTPFEDDSDIARQTRNQLATYAMEFGARQHRTHLFIVYIYYPCARFIRFDRAGALVSERFNFTHDCTPLIRFFSRFSKMTTGGRGFDTTVQVADELETSLARDRLSEWAPDPRYERTVFKMEVHDDKIQVSGKKVKKARPRKFLVWGSFADPDRWPLGRATRGYPALEVTDGVDNVSKDAPIMFLKEQWRSTALRQEIDILRELNEKGVEHVPMLICGGVLPGQVTQTGFYAIGRRSEKNIAERAHVRFVVLEVGRPLERFSSSKEMVKAVYDAFQGHKQAFEKCNLLHRDVSGGNILLLSNGGLLIDWDMAVKADGEEHGTTSGTSERVGTWDFMSIDLLGSTGRPHKISDDLESFLWVLLYYSLLYLPHNKVDELKKIIYVIFEQSTNYCGEVKGGEGKYTAVTTGRHIGFDACPPLEFTGNKPLTQFMQAMLILLMNYRTRETAARRRLVLLPIFSDRSDYMAPSIPPPPTQKERQDDMELLFKFALNLSWPTDDKSKLHNMKNSEGVQVPAAGIKEGESKKRKNITQDKSVKNAEDRPLKKAKGLSQKASMEGT